MNIYKTAHAAHIADAIERIIDAPVQRDLEGMQFLGRKVKFDELQFVSEEHRSQFMSGRGPTGRFRIRVSSVPRANSRAMAWGHAEMRSFPPRKGGVYDYGEIALLLVGWVRHRLSIEAAKVSQNSLREQLLDLLGLPAHPKGLFEVDLGDNPTLPVNSITLVGPLSLEAAAKLIRALPQFNQGEKGR